VSHRFTDEDRLLVRRLVAELEASGIPCWYAPRDTDTSGDYGSEIVDAIKEATAVVALISPAANDSDHIRNELTIAMEAGITTIGLMTSWEIPIRSGLQYRIAGVQKDFTPQHRASTTEKLITELSALTDAASTSPSPDSPASMQPSAAPGRTYVAPLHRLAAPVAWVALAHGDALRLVASEEGALSVMAVEPDPGQRPLQRARLGDTITALTMATSGRALGVAVDGELRTATITPNGRLEWHDLRRPLPAGADDFVALRQQGESWMLWFLIEDRLAHTTFHSLGGLEEVVVVEQDPHKAAVADALGSTPLTTTRCDSAFAGHSHLFAGVDAATPGDVLRLVAWSGKEVEQRTLPTGGTIDKVAVARAPAGRGKLGPVLAAIGDEILVWDWQQAESIDGPS